MRSSRCVRLLLALLACLFTPAVLAQPSPIGTWTPLPSFQSVEALAASGDAIWAASPGGIFSFEPATGEIRRFTRGDGLSSTNPSALAWEPAREALWVGYPDGSLDRIDAQTGAVQNYFDIRRADQYPSRAVNRLRLQGDSLLISADFGLVVFDAVRGEVRDTYSRLGPVAPATAVYDALFAPLPAQAGALAGAPGLWLATEEGVVWGPRSANLREPSTWTRDDATPDRARSLSINQGRVWLGTATSLHRRSPAGGWTQTLNSGFSVVDFVRFGERLFSLDTFGMVEVDAQVSVGFGITGYGRVSSAVAGPDGRVWVGDRREGLAALPPLQGSGNVLFEAPAQKVLPEGPINNLTRTVSIGPDGSVWVGHGVSYGRSGLSRLRPDGTWERFASGTTEVPVADVYETYIDPEGRVYAGTFGPGLVEVQPDGAVEVYDESNSSLQDATVADGYMEVYDATRGPGDALWVTNGQNGRPFHVQLDGVWTGFPAYSELPNRSPRRLLADRFGYIWFTLDETRGGGMGAIDARGTPAEPSDDQVFVLSGAGSDGTGLPHPNVRTLAEDPDGRLWIGTERGLAFILSPGSAFGSDPGLARPVWARVPDGSSYFLRDLFIFDIAIDPAGQKWIGSTAGAFLTNAAGDEVLEQFTTGNSPILSDEVLSVAVDPSTGTAYFATSRGLIAYQTQATEPAAAGADLQVFPNPLRGADADVVVRDLPGSEDGPGALKVLTVDGQVVFEDETRGGTYVWSQPRDRRTGRPLAPGVYIVAVSGDGGTSYGKLAVIR